VQFYVIIWIPIALMTGVMFPTQMLQKYPEPGKVIPLVVDFYVWVDLFLFPRLITYILSVAGDRWTAKELAFLFFSGMIAAALFQLFVIVPGKYPSTLGGAGRTTVIGYLHMPFFALVWTVVWMFVLRTVPTNTVFIVAVAFALIIPVNMLVPLHFTRKWFQLAWAPDVFGQEPRLFWMIGGAWLGTIAVSAIKLVIQR
jgi:hypothetical protein